GLRGRASRVGRNCPTDLRPCGKSPCGVETPEFDPRRVATKPCVRRAPRARGLRTGRATRLRSVSIRFNEDSYAEQPALEWLTLLGWEHLDGSRVAPGAPAEERSHWEDVVLAERLKSAIVRLNPELSG